MSVTILNGDALTMLKTLPSDSVQVCVTSPPYFALRAYKTEPAVWGGDPEHDHAWGERRYYVEGGGGAGKSGEAFSQPGQANAERIKAARWRDDAVCSCGAWRGELGLEPTPALFIEHLVAIFEEVKRVLHPSGLCFVNLGDSYAGSGKGPSGHNGIGDQEQRQGFLGSKQHTNAGSLTIGSHEQEYRGIPAKNLLLIPERFAIAMQDAGWWVRSRIAWCKTSAMPESVRDRPTSAWEHIWMFSKSARYFYDTEAVRQPSTSPEQDAHNQRYAKVYDFGMSKDGNGQPNNSNHLGLHSRPGPGGANLRNFWLLGPEPSKLEHYASYPSELVRRCILAGSRKGDTVLDPFLGSGTTLLVASRLERSGVGIELSPTYARMAEDRIRRDVGPMFPDEVRAPAAPASQPPLLALVEMEAI